GVVALDLYVDAGWVREARPGVSYLTSRLLEEGTRTRPAHELAAAIEDVGGSVEVSPAWTSRRVRAEDLPLALELLADVGRDPPSRAGAVDWARHRILAELLADLEAPSCHADLISRGLVYGGHPLGRDPRGNPRDLRTITRDEVIAHHRRHFAPGNAFLVA